VMEYKHNDGGEWFYKPFLPKHPRAREPKTYFGSVAIAIASDISYIDAHEKMKFISETSKTRRVQYHKLKEYICSIGFDWHSTMRIGSGVEVHLRKEELPKGNLIIKVSGDLVAVIDGVINHYHDPRRYDGEGNVNRAVYGYWKKQE